MSFFSWLLDTEKAHNDVAYPAKLDSPITEPVLVVPPRLDISEPVFALAKALERDEWEAVYEVRDWGYRSSIVTFTNIYHESLKISLYGQFISDPEECQQYLIGNVKWMTDDEKSMILEILKVQEPLIRQRNLDYKNSLAREKWMVLCDE